MSTYDPVSGTWTHVDTVDWDTANNTSYGGVDVAGNKVYVTDMRTTDAENGVVEFDTSTGAVSRFAAGTDAIDLTIGLDGLLYVLSPGGSPEGRIIDVYDPATYTFIRTIQLTPLFGWNGHRSVAVDHNGDVFIADWDGEIHHVTAAGDLVQTIAPPCDLNGREIFCSFNDIDISPSGQLVLGSRFGEIFVTDTSFSTVSRFEVGTRSAFVEFVPEPPAPTEVDMDVRPGRDPNKINLSRKVNVWIAILSNEGFDATTEVDAYSVRLGAAGAAINRSPRYSDVDGDGDRDLRLRFTVAEIGIVCGDTELSMTGMLVDGTEIVASDAIITRGCN
jgi:hypothetical protein